ncbi:hypothetical protein DL89DRAFT_323973 [Linderina pennispora]|uniref:Uncharacterized protein n=1 Tax=Linderina pennispora TaxID=61395 RepID=A0A1Y1W2J2_9FUNG|nr:uncharacterized protein DL89DRAFT_323973 [Linderina pennispora]ORX67771.1 hypothetical protein DL89DRAFT_323973 [Linderina pennispora]
MAIETLHDGMQRRFSAGNSGQLPLPSPMSTRSASSSSSSKRLIQILQYLNPLYYARIAQTFLASVLEVYGLSGTQSSGRIAGTGHDNGESMMGYESLQDDPAGANAHHYITANYLPPDVSDQITYLPNLNLGDEYRHSTLVADGLTPFTDAVLEPLSASATPKPSLDAADECPSPKADDATPEEDPAPESNNTSPEATAVDSNKSPEPAEQPVVESGDDSPTEGVDAACDGAPEAALNDGRANNEEDIHSERSTQCSETPTVRAASPREPAPAKNKNRPNGGRKSKRNRSNRRSKVVAT